MTTEDYTFLEDVFAQIMSTEAPQEHRAEFLKHEPLKAEQELFADVFTQIKAEELKAEQDTEPSKKPEQAKQDFTFTFSASEHPYNDKNSIFWAAVNYRRVTLSLSQFEKIIRRGFCFTSIFKQEKFLVKDKTEANWIGSQFVVFDLDNVRPEVTLNTFISSLYMKPTVAYTTPNNNIKKPKENKAYSRFRLVYLFDSIIASKTLYQSIYNTLEANFPLVYFDNTKKKDNCGSSPVQQFAGNALPTCELIINKESIYSLSSFPTQPSKPTEPSKKPSTEPSKPTEPSKKPSTEPNLLNDTFFHDLNSMKPVDFLNKCKEFYDYEMIDHTKLEFIDGYALTPDDYLEVKRKYRWFTIGQYKGTEYVRVKNGSRHNTLFAWAKLRCQIKPSITLEELVYNAVYDRTYFIDNKDKEITNESLIEICKAAKQANYKMKMKDKPKFKIDKEYCKEHGMSPKQYKNIIRRKLNFDSIDAWYDPAKSVAENLKYAEEHTLKNAKQRTLYTYCKARKISTKGTKPTEPTEPSPTTPYDEPKPSAEPTASKEQKEAVKSAPEATRAKNIIRLKRANFLAFIEYHTKRKRYSKYQERFNELVKTKTIQNNVF